MAILIADTKLETETDAWYMFYADTKEDIQTLPTSTSTGSSYRVRKYARPTSVAYCIEEARQYMLDSKDRWRAMCGLSDSVLDALSKSAAELLAICKDTENFRDEAVKSAEKAEKDKEASAANALAADRSAKKASESEGVASQKAENAKEAAEASNKSAEEASKSAAGALASEQAASESARLSSISEAASKDAMNEAKDFSNSASKSAREALESKRAAEDAANSASESSLAAASSERAATEKAAESSELAIRTEKNAELSKERLIKQLQKQRKLCQCCHSLLESMMRAVFRCLRKNL